MMQVCRSLLLAFAIVIWSVLPAGAQPRVPDEAMALGGWVGAALPTGDGLENGPHLAATLDGYLTPRLSVRGEVGIGWIGGDRRGFRSGLRPLVFNVNLVYNWERGVWHPYITGGLGLYRYTSAISAGALLDPALRDQLIALGLDPTQSAGRVEVSDNKLGANLGGGIEHFLTRRSTIVGDFRYHAVGNIGALAPVEGSFVRLSVGLKRYF
jgi:outer membrane protein with beta-barrel domain